MVDINLDVKSGNYVENNYKMVISNSVFQTNFQNVSYEITYQEDFPVFSSAWRFYVYVKEKKGGSIIFTYYPYFYNDVVTNIEVFFSVHHPNSPLIVGLKPRGEETKYYTFRYLRSVQELNEFPENPNFQINNVESELKKENKIRNNLLFKINDKSKNYIEKINEKSFAPFIKYEYYVDKEEFYGPYILSTDILFDQKENNFINKSLLNTVNGKSFDFINMYYSDNNIALLVEFIDYSTETGTRDNYYFKRLTRDGKHWKEISSEVTDIDTQEITRILEKVVYSINKSIVIYINKNSIDTSYFVKLIDNSNDLYAQISKKLSGNIKVKQDSNLYVSKYKCFYHDLSHAITDNKNEISDVAGIRLFIKSDSKNDEYTIRNDFEIKLYNSTESNQNIIYYKPIPGLPEYKFYVYVYFYDKDIFPLLIYQGGHWYKPKSKKDYFDKWIEEPWLKDSKPKKLNQFLSENKILIELKKINREMNEILLDNIISYGFESEGRQNLSGFDTIRINVNKHEPTEKYRKIIHSTKNKGDIGEIKKRDQILQDIEKTRSVSDVLSRQISSKFNTVSAYYHISDLSYKNPILLCVGSEGIDTENNFFFYERFDASDNSKWKRTDKKVNLNNELILTEKINDIHYKFNKSVVIEIENQSIIGYDLKLVDNIVTNSPSLSDEGIKISISEEHGLLSNSDYTCYKHTIPSQKTTVSSKTGGLRLYISSKEIFTFSSDRVTNSSIYYQSGIDYICVYFYHCDTVPLLVSYNNQYYKPNNKNDYFNRWVLDTDITNQNEQIQSKLDEINRNLNEVNISEITDDSRYGITGNTSLEFSSIRIIVKRCKNKYFRRITHSTLNKFSIGKVVYNGKPINNIELQNSYNQVSVYYLNSDIKYTKPLLISTDLEGSFVFKSKWYSRSDIDGNVWLNEPDTNIFTSNPKIRKKLISIHSKYYVPLNLQIEAQYNYNNIFTAPSDEIHNGLINIDRLNSNHTFYVKNYLCLYHKLSTYYKENKNEIIFNWNLGKSQLIFELNIHISENKLTLIDKNQIPISILKYTKSDFENKNVFLIYFYEFKNNSNNKVDNVPLMFKFKNQFFAPVNKYTYFHQWKEVEIQLTTGSVSNSIKVELDKINEMLNEIDLSKNSNYGIPHCSKYLYFKKREFSTKRIDVNIYSNAKHVMRVHNTYNKYKIGNIKPIAKCSFREISSHLKSKNIDQVVTIFRKGYMTNPELILFNGYTSNNNYITYCYYYKLNKLPKPFEYRFQDVPNGFSLMDKLTGELEKYQWNSNEHLEPILKTLKGITLEKLDLKPQISDIDTVDCINTDHRLLEANQCHESSPGESIKKLDQDTSEDPSGTGSTDRTTEVLTWDNFVDYIKNNPEVIYGSGSSVIAAGSVYPIYKVFSMYIK